MMKHPYGDPRLRIAKYRLAAVALLAAAFMGGAADGARAQGFGDLVVTPTRLVLEGRNTTEQVTLSNRGAETATFRISLALMTMDEDGNLKETDAPPPGLLSATDLVRYAPRQVVLAPGASQVVRLTVRKPQDLAEGEYRTHLFLRAIPPEDRGTGIAATPTASGEMSIELIPIFGISIPVIVRHGNLAPAQARLTGLAFAQGPEGGRVEATIERSGVGSLFGDVIVRHLREGSEPLVVGEVSRLAVYPEIGHRRIVVPVATPDGRRLEGGRLEVVYHAASEARAALASAAIEVK